MRFKLANVVDDGVGVDVRVDVGVVEADPVEFVVSALNIVDDGNPNNGFITHLLSVFKIGEFLRKNTK